MEDDIWLGSEASFTVIQKYQEKFSAPEFIKEAFHPGRRSEVVIDPVFGVDEDRPGLTLLRKINDRTVMQVSGSLTPSFSYWHKWVRGEVVSYEAIRDALAICEEQGLFDLIMHFDSNGGSVRGLAQTSDAMKRYQRAGGKISCHGDALVASAAYWLFCGGNSRTASEMCELGSIGTMAVIRTYVNTEQTMGVKFTVIKAGKDKALGNPFEAMTDEIKKKLQKNIDETNSFFLKRVSIEMNLMISETDVWAEGQVFFAGKAKQVGLIDRVATMDDLLGSGPAADNPSDTRRFEMTISAEKLAQIQAGADPKTVLTAAELETYMAGIEAAKVAEGANTKGEGEQETPEVEANKGDEGKPAVVDTPVVSMSEDLKKALKENGKLEVQLEASAAELAKLKEANATLTQAMESLQVVAQAAVGNLQRALGKPLETKASVPEILAQYNELQSQMAVVFKTGQQTKAAVIDDSTKPADGSVNYRLRSAPQPQKTGR